jgi:hypothetical protein
MEKNISRMHTGLDTEAFGGYDTSSIVECKLIDLI